MAMRKKKGGNGGTQTMIPGTERERIEELEKAGQAYKNARDERMECTEEEVKCKARLRELLVKYSLEKYKLDSGDVAEIVHGDDDVKVRKPKNDGTQH